MTFLIPYRHKIPSLFAMLHRTLKAQLKKPRKSPRFPIKD